jgi:hypothetical protein
MTMRAIDVIQKQRPALEAAATELIRQLAVRNIEVPHSTAVLTMASAIAEFDAHAEHMRPEER